MFEIEGWKRIIPVREMFEQLNLDIDEYELSYQKVHHPNSHSVEKVLETLKGKGNSWFKSVPDSFQVWYYIAFNLKNLKI